MCCLQLLSCCSGRVEQLQQRRYGLQNLKYLLFGFFFLKYLFIYYYFFWLQQVLVAAHGAFRCGAWAPEHVGSSLRLAGSLVEVRASSVVVVRGLSCPAACGILVPQPGIKPASPALEGGFFTTGPPGKSLFGFLKKKFTDLWCRGVVGWLVGWFI